MEVTMLQKYRGQYNKLKSQIIENGEEYMDMISYLK